MTKQYLIVLGLVLAILAVVGVGAIAQADSTLTASISAPASASVGESINLSVSVTGGNGDYTYVWDFGDGSQAAGQAPVHSYTTAGIKTISVVVGDTDNHQTSVSQTIMINEVETPLTATIVTPTDGSTFSTINPPIHFDVQVSGGNGDYTYVWDFGDGSQAAGQAPEHAYSATGTKAVSVVVGDTDNHQASDSINLTIIGPAIPPVLPVVTFTANGQTGSINVSTTTVVTLAWTSTDAASCAASGDWSGVKNLNGSENVGPFAAGSSKTFTLVCTGAGGSTEKNIIVNTNNGIPAPTIDLRANGQAGSITVSTTTATTLSWTTTDAASCAASGDWSGSRATSGSESVGPFAANSSRTFVLNCTGPGGSQTDSVTVVTTGESSTTLVISNVRVTDVTRNSAIVRWDTNLVSTSRVIYDTTSHPSISGQSAPNYGYQFSTATDSTMVVTHAVSVTGLSSNTQYFFRVISEN